MMMVANLTTRNTKRKEGGRTLWEAVLMAITRSMKRS